MEIDSHREKSQKMNPQERLSFRRELVDNLKLLLELIDAIRSECALADDRFTAMFFAGLHTTVAAFVNRSFGHQARNRLVVTWPQSSESAPRFDHNSR